MSADHPSDLVGRPTGWSASRWAAQRVCTAMPTAGWKGATTGAGDKGDGEQRVYRSADHRSGLVGRPTGVVGVALGSVEGAHSRGRGICGQLRTAGGVKGLNCSGDDVDSGDKGAVSTMLAGQPLALRAVGRTTMAISTSTTRV